MWEVEQIKGSLTVINKGLQVRAGASLENLKKRLQAKSNAFIVMKDMLKEND